MCFMVSLLCMSLCCFIVHSRNSVMTPSEVTSTSQEIPSSGLVSSSIECPPVDNSRNLFHGFLREPQEQVVIPSFSESDDESVVSENRSLLLDHLTRQNRSDRRVPSSTSFTASFSGRTTFSSSAGGSLRLIPRHSRPRTSAYSVSVPTTHTSSSGSMMSNTSSEGLVSSLPTHSRDFTGESEHISANRDSDISEDESSISLSDLFDLEENTARLRRQRSRDSFASLFDLRDGSDSDSAEGVLRSDGVYEMQLNHPSSADRSVPGPSSSSSNFSLITISDIEDQDLDHSSTSTEEDEVHIHTGGLGNIESRRTNVEPRPEVIVVGDSSEDEEEVNKYACVGIS